MPTTWWMNVMKLAAELNICRMIKICKSLPFGAAKKESQKCLKRRFMLQTEAHSSSDIFLNYAIWNSSFNNSISDHTYFTQSWRFNSAINKKRTHFYMAIENAEMKLKSFFLSHWNLELLFMMQKWLLQKRIENRFQMNKFSFFLSKLNLGCFFTPEKCRLMWWRLKWMGKQFIRISGLIE